jgi:hypothetical protein
MGRIDHDREELDGYVPITPWPEPFPGDDTEVLTCKECGAEYTMREYRHFAWVPHSDLCVQCGSAAMSAKIHKLMRGLAHE